MKPDFESSPLIAPLQLRTDARTGLVHAQIPHDSRLYVIGDVHGCADLLAQKQVAIGADLAARPVAQALVICLGDYIDRGPDSAGVIDLLANWTGPAPLIALRGNHEQMLLKFLDDPRSLEDWRRYGGVETLASYGVQVSDVMRGRGYDEARADLQAAMPAEHLAFVEETWLCADVGGFFFCHAGVRPKLRLEDQAPDDLLGIRDEFLNHKGPFRKLVVHGHTPVQDAEILANRVNLDTGAYITGRLTCLCVDGDAMRFV